jgi:hypothetical protein
MKKTNLPLIVTLTVIGILTFSLIKTVQKTEASGSYFANLNYQQQKKDATGTKETKDVYTCPMHPKVTQDKPGKCPTCGMNLVKKEPAKTTYTCPMHPDVSSDKPGKCPKCGMNLVEKNPSKKDTPKKN